MQNSGAPLPSGVVAVEWLEVLSDDGLADITTEYRPSGLDNDIYIGFRFIGFRDGSNRSSFFHNYTGNDTGRRFMMNQSLNTPNKVLVYNGSVVNETPNTSVTLVQNTEYSVEFHNETKNVIVNGQSFSAVNSSNTEDRGNPLHILGAWSEEAKYNPHIYLYYFKWVKAGVRVLDLVPVRVGDEGFMYDRVSGRLFGNSGTGRFVVGPDVIL